MASGRDKFFEGIHVKRIFLSNGTGERTPELRKQAAVKDSDRTREKYCKRRIGQEKGQSHACLGGGGAQAGRR